MNSLIRYLRVLRVFARNSLVRTMSFRVNFMIECLSSLGLGVDELGLLRAACTSTPSRSPAGTQYPYFVFLATVQFIYSLAEAFFMPNAEEFSELVRTGGLGFRAAQADRHAVARFARENRLVGPVEFRVRRLSVDVRTGEDGLHADAHRQVILYPVYILSGVAILYSLTIILASTSVWMGRNQTITDYWFYITNFSRYPLEIYAGPFGTPLQVFFTFFVPVLVVVNVPARMLARPLTTGDWRLAGFALVATALMFGAARWVFQRALASYRSASS